MIFNKIAAFVKKLGRLALACIFAVKNTFHRALSVDQGNPAGGMFGELVSRDTTHRQY